MSPISKRGGSNYGGSSSYASSSSVEGEEGSVIGVIISVVLIASVGFFLFKIVF